MPRGGRRAAALPSPDHPGAARSGLRRSAIVGRVRRHHRPRRQAARAAVLLAPFWLSVALPAAALADDTPGHAAPLGVGDGLLIFLVIPVGVFFFVALFTLRPGSSSRAQRYRPGRPWKAEPSWTGVAPHHGELPVAQSDDPHAPLHLPHTEAGPHAPVMAGAPHHVHASSQAEHDHPDGEEDADLPPEGPHPPTETGGARGSW